ncbi:MAG: PqqD family protein [Caulobacteraceae bacterium]|jgi:hypothetical protein
MSEATLTLDTPVRVNPEVLFQDLDGEAVLLHLGSGVYFGLDEVGARIWSLLAEGADLRTVSRTVAGEYGVDEARCAEDLIELVAEMEKHALVD